jgi:hypothetical protein
MISKGIALTGGCGTCPFLVTDNNQRAEGVKVLKSVS